MPEICPNCGLPKDICSCEIIAREEEKIKISVEKKRYGKAVTFVAGISKDVNLRDLLKELKNRLACGGTMKEGIIELQGDHRKKIVDILSKLGFPQEKIEVS